LASSPPISTAAEVSSHDVSMPRTASATGGAASGGVGGAGRGGGRGGGAPLHHDRIGNGGGGNAAWSDDRDPGGPASGSADMRDHAERVARQRLYALFRAADGDRDARRRDDEARDRAGARLDGNP